MLKEKNLIGNYLVLCNWPKISSVTIWVLRIRFGLKANTLPLWIVVGTCLGELKGEK